MAVTETARKRVAARARRLADGYRPPDYAEVPSADAAIFLCAIDHKTGYTSGARVAGEGPFEGSALLWALGLDAERRRPVLLSSESLCEIDAAGVAEIFGGGGGAVAGPEIRARLWRDLAEGLAREYRGDADALLDACEGRLGGTGGLLERMARFEAYADPLEKKSFLLAKICARRGWLDVTDSESWQVCADNVLMRIALRSGLVAPGTADEVRAATRAALRGVADESGIPPPVLDDMLWELGREDPDLVGADAGELREPPRPEGTSWY